MEQKSSIKKRKNIFGQLIIFYWLPVVLWMCTIFYFSSRHSVQVSQEYILNFLFFKLLHIIEYGFLFLLIFRAINRSYEGLKTLHSSVMAFIVTIIYAMSDEMHQYFVPSRSPQPTDVIIDAIGALIVWYYLSTQLQKAPEKLKKLVKILGVSM